MSDKTIRESIRRILLETRGSLPFFVILKKWVEIAAEYGEETEAFIDRPEGQGYGKATQMLLILSNRNDALKVFDGLSAEVKEFVLKHWKTREYFTEMIKGVKIGLVKAYKQSNWGGLKSGNRDPDGGYVNIEGLGTGSMQGYLTMRGWSTGLNYTGDDNRRRNAWLKIINQDLKNDYDSTMVHEFQHWFQESVLYQHSSNMHLSPRTPKGDKKKAKTTLVLSPPIAIQDFLIEEFIEGVDFSDNMIVANVKFYKIESLALLEDSLCPMGRGTSTCMFNSKGKLAQEVSPMAMAIASKFPSDSDLKKLITKIIRDFLKIKDITNDDIEELNDKIMDQLKSANAYSTLFYPLKKMLADKYAYPNSWVSNNLPKDDRPTGGTYKREVNELLSSLQRDCRMFVLTKSAFDKEGKLKSNKGPVKASAANLKKAVYLGFSTSSRKYGGNEDRFHAHRIHRQYGRSSTSYREERNPGESWHAEWKERWVEFDAELANYSQSAIRRSMDSSDSVLPKMITLGKQEEATRHVAGIVKGRLRGRGMGKTLNQKGNEEHVERLCDRMVELLIETGENYSYQWWFDNKRTAYASSPSEFDAWARGSNASPYRQMMGYYRWLLKKAAGEKV